MKQSQKPLLIVEDSDEDFAALSRTIAKANIHSSIYRCEDGEDALEFLYHEGAYQDPRMYPRPALILLDLNLPGTDGRDVLNNLKQDAELRSIPVIVLTTSSNPKDIESCYRQGASGYLVKPMNLSKLRQLVETFLEYWFRTVELPPMANN
ncbi:response regulator [Pleurocapsales cyanobacterium LEGE 10410]|nr:response regulator [Pleurocapsales cyanobacterium LEGE 10410]